MVDERYVVLRQFKVLAIRDLLFLQAEIAQLEGEFQAVQARDRGSEGEEMLYDRNWYMLSTSKNRDCSGEQWSKALEIRTSSRNIVCDSRRLQAVHLQKR